MWKPNSLFCGIILLSLSPVSTSATTMPYLNIANLAQQAHTIIKGRVQHISVVNQPNNALTQHLIRISVTNQYKPEAISSKNLSKHIFVRTIGHSVQGKYSLRVAGAPQFTLGENVVLFLEKMSTGNEFVILGMAQGKFKIAFNNEAGQKYAMQENLSHTSPNTKNNNGTQTKTISYKFKAKHAQPTKNLPLWMLEALIEKYAN